MMTSGFAEATAARIAAPSRPSATTGSAPIRLIAPKGNPVTVKLSRCVQQGADGRNFTVPEILAAGWRNQAARGRRRVPQGELHAPAIAERNKKGALGARLFP